MALTRRPVSFGASRPAGRVTWPTPTFEFSYAVRALGEILLFTLDAALGIAVSWAILRWDLGRLAGEELARAWPDSTLWMAIVLLGPFSVPFHFIRTRRSWAGLDMALFWLTVAVLLSGLPGQGLRWVFGMAE
jgi:hypothetical protein